MQQVDAITLSHLAREWKRWLVGTKISKVQHPSVHEFLFTLWGGSARPGHLNGLYFHLNPQLPFCALVSAQHKKKAVFHQFSQPTTLCMLLRKHLNGANIIDVEAPEAERIIHVTLENENELGRTVRFILTVELMGKHSNMILHQPVSVDEKPTQPCFSTIVAVAHGVSEKMSSFRELASGLPYSLPPVPVDKRLFSQTSLAQLGELYRHKPEEMSLISFLNANFRGLGKQIVQLALSGLLSESVDKTLCDAMLQKVYERLSLLTVLSVHPADSLDVLQPCVSYRVDEKEKRLIKTAFSLFSVSTGTWKPFASVNAMVADYFVSTLQAYRVAEKQKNLLSIIQQQEKRVTQKLRTLEPVAEEILLEWQAKGDRILAALGTKELLSDRPAVDQRLIVLTDYRTGQPLEIDIQPQHSWVKNAQLYYRYAKKAKARNRNFVLMIDTIKTELAYIKEMLRMVQQAEDFQDLEHLAEDWKNWQVSLLTRSAEQENEEGEQNGIKHQSRQLPKNRKKNSRLKKNSKTGKHATKDKIVDMAGVMEIGTADGYTILVGKSGKGNETLVGKLSRPDDIWLHVHEMPGSHVLLRAPEGSDSFLEALEKAATLAVYYSSARQSVNVPVIYTASRFVRKIPRSYPGHVTYKGEKTVFITVNPNLLSTLIQSEV